MSVEPRPGRVAGKKVLITGAAGGLGEAMAFMMAREGATLALTDIDETRVADLAWRVNVQTPGSAFAAVASAPCTSPVNPPCVTTEQPASRHNLRTALTSSVLDGRTSALH